jgi:hypothetical protein
MQTQPTIPGQPAPRSPGQTDQVIPADPRAPGIPGQTSQPQRDLPGQAPAPGLAGPTDRVMPGQQGTIPEVVGRPEGTVQSGRTATASRDDIRRAQEALRAQGHNPGSMDGNMDNRTQQALRDFQQANRLPVTGTLDQQTAAKLGIDLHSGSTTPQRGQEPSMPQGSETAPSKRAVQ